MKMSARYGSHLPVLISIVNATSGPILELGTGLFSTPYLHFACLPTKRRLVSYDSDEGWIHNFKDFRSDFHEVIFIDDWDKLDTNGQWDIVLVDHGPDERRQVEAKRFAGNAKYIILHDSNPEYDYLYKYSEVYPLYRNRFDYNSLHPNTTVLSNQSDLSGLKEGLAVG